MTAFVGGDVVMAAPAGGDVVPELAVMATISTRMSTTPTPAPATIRAREESRRRCLSGGLLRSEGGQAPPGVAGATGGTLGVRLWPGCPRCSGAFWTSVVFGSGAFPAGACIEAASSCAVRTSARVVSSTLSNRLVSNSKRLGLSARACRRTSLLRLSGSSSARGILDLQPHEVIGVIETTPPMLVGDRQPLIADQRQQHVAGPDCSGDHLDEVVAQLDRVDVLEDLAAAEAVSEPVEQPAGRVGGLLPPVADEDPAWSCRRGCSHDLFLGDALPPFQPGSIRPPSTEPLA